MIYKRKGTASIILWEDELVVYHHDSGDTHLLPLILPHSLVFFCFQQDLLSFERLLDQMKAFSGDVQYHENLLRDFLDRLVQIDILQFVT